jgi:hypothetical protein
MPILFNRESYPTRIEFVLQSRSYIPPLDIYKARRDYSCIQLAMSHALCT